VGTHPPAKEIRQDHLGSSRERAGYRATGPPCQRMEDWQRITRETMSSGRCRSNRLRAASSLREIEEKKRTALQKTAEVYLPRIIKKK